MLQGRFFQALLFSFQPTFIAVQDCTLILRLLKGGGKLFSVLNLFRNAIEIKSPALYVGR
jgi:hypothetical protein